MPHTHLILPLVDALCALWALPPSSPPQTLTKAVVVSFAPVPRVLDDAGRFPTLSEERGRAAVGSVSVTATRACVASGGFPVPPRAEASGDGSMG